MKKFRFALDPVLEYKQKMLDSLQTEHQALLGKVYTQEQTVASVKHQYDQINLEYRGKKAVGMLVAEAMSYEMGLKVLEKQILLETQRLATLRRQAEEKLAELVAAKQDTTSIEKLRDKQLGCYQAELQKSQERFIDDLVCARGGGRRSTL